jgi:hypothetical protein
MSIKSTLGYISLLLASCVFINGCSKTGTNSGEISGASHSPSAYYTLDATKSPFYGDSVLFVQGAEESSYLFHPVNQLGTGIFVSWPAGLSLDPHTGVIDVSKSEPGSLYRVGFISATTGDTAYRQLIVPGFAYRDGIYFVNGSDSLLQPFYFAGNPAVASGSETTSAASVSLAGIFDEPGPSGLRAQDLQLNVNTNSGVINLKNSIQAGLFGPMPQNGDIRQVDIYYRVNDNSHMSLQRTSVIVHYYNTLGDVPEALIGICQANQQVATVNSTGSSLLTGSTSQTIVFDTKPISSSPSARPPHIVVVIKGH